MPSLWILALLLLAGSFLLSGVLPAYLRAKSRIHRVDRFAAKYGAWVENDMPSGGERDWLIARGPEMQADAKAVGQGVIYVAPPPMIGGRYRPHYMFSDLAGAQSFGAGVAERLDALTMTQHQLRVQAGHRRRDLSYPWRWVQRAFERIVRLPQYLLRTAGFSDDVSGSTAAKGVGVLWSLVVGAATVGAFVLSLLEHV